MSKNKTVSVNLNERSYDIVVGKGLLQDAAECIKPYIKLPRVFIVTDENVAKYHLKALEKAFDKNNISSHSIILPSGENTKNFRMMEKLLNDLLLLKPERNDMLVAFGGGVIGDITGFAASILLRGVNFIQIPTTLLAMVDSSVGGKTGINTKYGKNLIGTFYQPRLVLADISLLETLPKREFLAGYAEIVKYGLINDEKFFADLERQKPSVANIANAVVESCKAKAAIVSADEKESGSRALLNLGHTFGHALETETRYSDKLLHGEAVAIGMVMVFQFSEHLGLCDKSGVKRVKDHLSKVGLPVSLLDIKQNFSAKKLLGHMYQDKKVQDGRLVFILTRGIGKAFIKKDVEEKSVLDFLKNIIAGEI